MKLPQLSLRELLLFVALVAMGCGWWVDRQTQQVLNRSILEKFRSDFDATYGQHLEDCVIENSQLVGLLEMNGCVLHRDFDGKLYEVDSQGNLVGLPPGSRAGYQAWREMSDDLRSRGEAAAVTIGR